MLDRKYPISSVILVSHKHPFGDAGGNRILTLSQYGYKNACLTMDSCHQLLSSFREAWCNSSHEAEAQEETLQVLFTWPTPLKWLHELHTDPGFYSKPCQELYNTSSLEPTALQTMTSALEENPTNVCELGAFSVSIHSVWGTIPFVMLKQAKCCCNRAYSAFSFP